MSTRARVCRGHAIPRAAFFLALLAWPAWSQSQAILANEIVEPRTFGHVVGDKIRREVHLSLRTGYRLDEAGLPKAGRLDRWLEIAAPEVSVRPISNGLHYRIVLTYQIFNAPLTLATVTLPQQDLRIIGTGKIGNIATGEPHAFTTLIPALRVAVAPVTSAVETDRLSEASLQVDRAPPPIPVEARQSRLAWMSLALLVLLLYAAWRRGLMAFIARGKLPFARAVRELRKLQPASGAPAPYAAGLKIVHAAINRTAGRAVFAHNLDEFLTAQPAYADLRAEFHELFAASGRVFFAGEGSDASSGRAWQALQGLCERCSRIERQLQRQSFAPRSSEQT